MVRHLTNKMRLLQRAADLKSGEVVLDIGSNDATSLKAYEVEGLTRIGIDPTGEKFRSYYPDYIRLVPDFFSAKNFRSVSSRRARIVTSISMFYDLEDPMRFASEVAAVLAPDGIWHFEQSYMPSMLRSTPTTRSATSISSIIRSAVVKEILDAAGCDGARRGDERGQRRKLRGHGAMSEQAPYATLP